MAFSESFASTAAQTIPVLALAATIELRIGVSLRYRFPSRGLPKGARRERFRRLGDQATGHVIWFILMIWLIEAEWRCLERLRGVQVPEGSDKHVQIAMIVALFALVVLPIVQWPLQQWLDWFDKNNVFQRGLPAEPEYRTLDDDPVV